MHPHLIDASELAKISVNTVLSANIVIVDCCFDLMNPGAGREHYRQGHIPGAWFFDLNLDLSSPVAGHGGRHPFPDLEEFVAKLRKCGVNHDTLIVAYDDSKSAFAARFWYLCQYIGHRNVKILNGGYGAWVDGGHPITTESPAAQPGNIIVHQTTQNLTYPDVKAISTNCPANTLLVDSREEPRYLGLLEPIDPIAGHIPGAKNLPWISAVDEKGFFLPAEQQAKRWESFSPDTNSLIIYCGSGVTACINLFSLTLAGQYNARLYAGSWSDWCSYQQTNS